MISIIGRLYGQEAKNGATANSVIKQYWYRWMENFVEGGFMYKKLILVPLMKVVGNAELPQRNKSYQNIALSHRTIPWWTMDDVSLY